MGISLDEDVPPVDMMVFPPPLRLVGLALDGGVGVAGPLVALPPTSPISPLPSDDDCARSATRVSSPPEGASATALEGGVRLWIPCLSNRGDRLEDGDRRTGMAVGRSSAVSTEYDCYVRYDSVVLRYLNGSVRDRGGPLFPQILWSRPFHLLYRGIVSVRILFLEAAGGGGVRCSRTMLPGKH